MNATGAGGHGWAQTNSSNLYRGDGGVCVCVLAHACVRACVRTWVRDVFAIYDNNI